MSKFGAIGLRPCQSAVNTTRKPSRGLATLRVKIWCDRAATLSKCCKYHTKTEQGFSKFACQNFVAIWLRPCKRAVNTTRKPSRGLASLRVKIWCDRAATVSKCCKYHTKTEKGLATLRVKIWCDRAATLSKCCKYHTKTEQGLATLRFKIWCDRAATLSKCFKFHTKIEQGFSKFACQNLVRSGRRLTKR